MTFGMNGFITILKLLFSFVVVPFFFPFIVYAGTINIGDLQGSWKLVAIPSESFQAILHAEVPNFTIKDWSIEGFDGCNRFWGRLDQPGSVSSTRIGCPEGNLKIPLDLFDPMSHLKSGRIEGKVLMLPERGAIPAAVFKCMDGSENK